MYNHFAITVTTAFHWPNHLPKRDQKRLWPPLQAQLLPMWVVAVLIGQCFHHVHRNRIIVHRGIPSSPKQYRHQHQIHNRGRMRWQTALFGRRSTPGLGERLERPWSQYMCAENPRTQINIRILDQIIIYNITNLWLRHSWTGQTRSSTGKGYASWRSEGLTSPPLKKKASDHWSWWWLNAWKELQISSLSYG